MFTRTRLERRELPDWRSVGFLLASRSLICPPNRRDAHFGRCVRVSATSGVVMDIFGDNEYVWIATSLLLGAVLIAAAYIYERKRTEALKVAARSLGLSFEKNE